MTFSFRLSRCAAFAASAMAFSFPFAASSSAIVANELEGHWSLNETDLESLQVLNTAPVADPEHGVRTETMKIGQFSPVGTGYYFDGETNDDYVELGSSFIDALRATNELTMSGWINPAFLRPGTNAASRQTIFAANAQLQFSLQAEGHFTYVYWRDEAYVTNLFGEAEAVEAGEFVHVALTHKHDPDGFGDDVLSLYINGELVQEIFPYPTISQFVIDGEMLHLGRYEGNTSRDFDGVMSDFGLWAGRALSHEEIAAIGALGRANVPLSSPDVDAVLELYAVQNGTVQTGDWEWSYTTVFPAPADGSDLGIGKHYYGSDDSVYLVLGGSEGNWQGVTASGGVPFGIPVTFLQEPENVDVEMGGTAVFEVVAEGTGALVYQWYFTSSEGTELI